MKRIITRVALFAAVYGLYCIAIKLNPNNIWATTFTAIISMFWIVAKQIVLTIYNVVISCF